MYSSNHKYIYIVYCLAFLFLFYHKVLFSSGRKSQNSKTGQLDHDLSHVCMSSSSVNWLTSFSWTVTVGGALKKWKMGQGGQKRFLLCAYHQQLTDFEGFYTTYLHENDEDKRTSMEDCSKVILVLLVTATDALRLCVVTCKQVNINRSLRLGFYSRKLSPLFKCTPF